MIAFHEMQERDIGRMAKLRGEVLIAANRLDESADMKAIEVATAQYFDTMTNNQVTYFAEADGKVVGCGSVCFYTLMPTYHNPEGKYAFIMNMYTKPEYRRRGIAHSILHLLAGVAESRGISNITLEATEAGRPLYEKYGFTPYSDCMIYMARNDAAPEGI